MRCDKCNNWFPKVLEKCPKCEIEKNPITKEEREHLNTASKVKRQKGEF